MPHVEDENKKSAVPNDPTAPGPEETFTPEDPHSDAPNFGEEGGSSQWGQRVLTADGVKERTISRDSGKGERK
jgi:hypothetical protein